MADDAMNPVDGALPPLPKDTATPPQPPPDPSDADEIPGLASFRRRSAAFLIDFTVLSLAFFAAELPLRSLASSPKFQAWLTDTLVKTVEGSTTDKLIVVGALVLVLALLMIPYDAYFVFFEYWLAATPGKKLVRIRVESLDTKPLSFKQCWTRQVLRHLDFLLVVPAVGGIIYGGRKQRLGDWAAGTIVVDVPNLPPWEIPERKPYVSKSSTIKDDEELPELPSV